MRKLKITLVAAVTAVAAATAGIIAYERMTTPDQAAVNGTADRLDRFLRESFPASFAGLEVDDAGHRIVVYRKPDPHLDRAVRGRSGEVPVDLRTAAHSLADLEPLARRIDHDRPYWRTRGVHLDGLGPRTDGSAVVVVVSRGDLAALQRAFRQRYGDDRIVLDRPGPIVPAG